jgi:hypothetical protein
MSAGSLIPSVVIGIPNNSDARRAQGSIAEPFATSHLSPCDLHRMALSASC